MNWPDSILNFMRPPFPLWQIPQYRVHTIEFLEFLAPTLVHDQFAAHCATGSAQKLVRWFNISSDIDLDPWPYAGAEFHATWPNGAKTLAWMYFDLNHFSHWLILRVVEIAVDATTLLSTKNGLRKIDRVKLTKIKIVCIFQNLKHLLNSDIDFNHFKLGAIWVLRKNILALIARNF